MNLKHLVALTFAFAVSPAFAQEDTRIDASAAQSQYNPGSGGGQSGLTKPEFRVVLPQKPLNGGTVGHPPISGDLTDSDLRRLAAHDIVLLIDKSWSMGRNDCPMPDKIGLFGIKSAAPKDEFVTRWEWCEGQTSHMAKQTEKALSNGFSVALFDGKFQVFDHVNLKELHRIFADHHPGGHTNLEEPLDSFFDDYFKRRTVFRGQVRPLLVGVITDGCPTHPDAVRDSIVEVTKQMRNPGEITIVFFLIGNHDKRGEEFVEDIGRNATKNGAQFNVVKSVPFSELEHIGLAKALAQNLQ